MSIKEISFKSNNLNLEGVLYLPNLPTPLPATLILHPDPRLGGDMNNNVVMAVANKLYDNNFIVLRFNFRGVGKSEGKISGGKEEVDDVKSAITFLCNLPEVDNKKIILIGYSFGAYVGLKSAHKDRRISKLVAISPPITFFDFSFLKKETRDKFFVFGDSDSFAPKDKIFKLIDTLPAKKEYRLIKNADHFFMRKEKELAEVIYGLIKFV